MPHALVTGCAGFIGSHTTEKLLAEGYTVTGLDNFSRFYGRDIKERNMAGFVNNPNFRFVEADLRDRETLLQQLTDRFDVVIHLAAKAGVRPSIQDPGAYIDVNVHGTNNIIDVMRQSGSNKLFFASSSSIYGNQKSIPFQELVTEDRPISPYAYTKRTAELLCHTNHHLYKIDIICARFFTVYGPRQRPDLAIHKFVRKMHNGETIQMFGDGSSARDYTFIEDTLQGIFAGVNYLQQHQGVFEIVNLGNNTPVKLTDLISSIGKALNIEPKIEQMPMQQGDVEITYADISHAESLLGYRPKTPIEEGLRRFVDWFYEQKHLHTV